MATQTLKVLLRPAEPSSEPTPSLLLFSAYDHPPFRSIRLRGKRATCPACSSTPKITREAFVRGDVDHAAFCGTRLPTAVLSQPDRVTPTQYLDETRRLQAPGLLVDVRERPEFSLVHLKGSINIPYSEIVADTDISFGQIEEQARGKQVFFVCRFGNDSQLAVRKFREFRKTGNGKDVKDITGGLAAWRRDIDPELPDY